MWLLFTTALAAPCGDDTSLDGLVSQLESSWERSRDDQPAMREAILEAESMLACVSEPLTTSAAARFHRNRALASMANGDPQGAVAAARAARRLDPAGSAAWVEGSLVYRELIDDAGEAESPVEELPTSLAARVYGDGEPRAARRTGEPVLVQVFSPEGGVVGSAWIDARQPMPEWLTYPPPTCEGTTVDRLLGYVEEAKQAYAQLDVDGFEQALGAVAEELPCLQQVLSPSQAAAIHRLEGLRLATKGARLGVVRSFQQAQLLDGAYEPPQTFIREGSTLDTLWKRAGSLGSPLFVDIEAPADLVVRLDGVVSSRRPATLPSILQVVGADGGVELTRYVPPTAAAPDLARFESVAHLDPLQRLPPGLREYKLEERRKRSRQARQWLQRGGAALYFGSGILLAVNTAHVAEFDDPRLTPERAGKLQRAANRSATTSAALLVAGTAAIGFSFALR